MKNVFPVLAALIFTTSLHAVAQANEPIQKQRAHPILTEEQAATLPEKSPQGDKIPLLDSETSSTLDALQQKSSSLPGSTASWIDSFFHTLPVQNNVYRSVGGTQ